jgi:hypothetical protein
MALGHTFYHASIRKMVVVFGNLFNDLYVRDFYENGNEKERRKVPISYGPKQKFLARLDAGQLDQSAAITLPRMAFELDNMTYDPERKLNSLTTLSNQKEGEGVRFTFAPVPYNFDFSLYIMVKSADDGTQLLEQILPYFTPHFNLSIKEFPDLDITRDVPVILSGLTQEDIYDGDFDTRRSIVWTLSFTMKGHMYGATRAGKLITSSTINAFFENNEGNGVIDAGIENIADNPTTGLETGDFGFSQEVIPGDSLEP